MLGQRGDLSTSSQRLPSPRASWTLQETAHLEFRVTRVVTSSVPCLLRAGTAAMEPESLYNLLQIPRKVDPPAEEELSQGAGRVGRRGRAGILRTPTGCIRPCIGFQVVSCTPSSVQPLPLPSALYLTPLLLEPSTELSPESRIPALLQANGDSGEDAGCCVVSSGRGLS